MATNFTRPRNVAKMSAGHPLTDEDRWPWLQAIADEIDRTCKAREHAVVACSALKRAYRDILVHGRDDVRIVFLNGTQELIANRLAARKGHFMPPGLLTSQFKTLEPPQPTSGPSPCRSTPRSRPSSMTSSANSTWLRMTPIKLVVSDCDGTLLPKDKTITEGAKGAVRALHEAGIGFTIVSSRPTIGMGFLIEPLGITLPIGAFNGSSIVDAQLKPIEQHLIAPAVAQRSIDVLNEFGVDIWLFTNDRWYTRNPDGEYVPHEQRAIKADPTIIPDFAPYLGGTCKIVGASSDPALLARCEAAMQKAVGHEAIAARSQTYYLDVTPAGYDKGTFAVAMAKRLGISLDAVATIGDMQNDLPMFAKSGVSFAMGNAADDIKKHATHVTDTNERDGFARAIETVLKARRSRDKRKVRKGSDAHAPSPVYDITSRQVISTRCIAGFSVDRLAALRLCAVLISAMCVSACGKLPVWRQAPVSNSSASRPRSLATAATRSNSACGFGKLARQHIGIRKPQATGEKCAFDRLHFVRHLARDRAAAQSRLASDAFRRLRWSRGRAGSDGGRKPTEGSIRMLASSSFDP